MAKTATNTPASAILLASLVLPVAVHAQDAWDVQVREQLVAAGVRFADGGYELTRQIRVGSLEDGEDDTIMFEIEREQRYMIMGVCDSDCSDLDIVLYHEDGSRFGDDLGMNAFPIMDVAVDRDRSFTLEARMAECSSEPCRYGLGVFASPDTGMGPGGIGGRSSPVAASGSAPNWGGTPRLGTIQLAIGFSPYEREVPAGGNDAVDLDAPDCIGYIDASEPTLDLNYTAGSQALRIHARSGTDVTLVVNQPNGSWICSDGVDGTNPIIMMSSPLSGNYNIWIGTRDPNGDALPTANLFISELDPR